MKNMFVACNARRNWIALEFIFSHSLLLSLALNSTMLAATACMKWTNDINYADISRFKSNKTTMTQIRSIRERESGKESEWWKDAKEFININQQ